MPIAHDRGQQFDAENDEGSGTIEIIRDVTDQHWQKSPSVKPKINEDFRVTELENETSLDANQVLETVSSVRRIVMTANIF
jgi:hypothetical protein